MDSAGISTFVANATGIGTKEFQLSSTGVSNGTSVEKGVSGLNTFDYASLGSERAAFLTTSIGTYTEATTWAKTHGPLDFASVVISD